MLTTTTAAHTSLLVLTLNIGALTPGGIFFAPKTKRRVNAICRQLESGPYDVVLIQEAWVRSYRKALAECGYQFVLEMEEQPGLFLKRRQGKVKTSKIKIISHMLDSLLRDSVGYDTGLMILSRHPISQGKLTRYKVNGVESRTLKDGEFPVNKGILSGVIDHPHLGEIFIANTHVVSFYDDRTYDSQRVDQLRYLKEYIEKESKGKPTIVGGDFNISPSGIGGKPRDGGSDRQWNFIREGIFELYQQANLDYEKLKTYPSHNHTEDFGVLDHLFSKNGLIPGRGGLDFTRPALSDHFGLYTEFSFQSSLVHL